MSNKIYLHRSKNKIDNKIGTHVVPTAELSLEATEACLHWWRQMPLAGDIKAYNATCRSKAWKMQ